MGQLVHGVHRLGPAAVLATLLLGCPPAAEPPAPAGAPLGMDAAQLFQYIATGDPQGDQPVGQLPARPFYSTWPLFPGPADDPDEFLNKRLGLAVHGRWVTVYVNPLALAHLEGYLEQVGTVPVDGTPVVPPTDFPPGSVIVKVNFGNDPGATVVRQAAEPGVLTVAYKPQEGFCQSGVRPGGDCLGGEWLWAFFGLGKAQALDPFVAESAGTFCVNCHLPAFKADHLRGLLRRARRIALDRVPETRPAAPPDLPADDPFCEAPVVLRAASPADVALDPATLADPAARQKLFDCFAWRTFVALNWPASAERGVADAAAAFAGAGDRVWETFAQTYEVFQPGDPAWVPATKIWTAPRRIPSVCSGAPVISMVAKSQSAFADLANETGQAFAGTFGTLTDRNGKLVHYQVLFNRAEFDFFLDGGKAATANLTPVGPAGGPEPSLPEGSIEVKAAWKELCLDPACKQRDREADYYTRTVWVYDADGPACRPMQVGLVGLHVAAKTFWAPQWAWATFEHRANAPLAELVADGSPPVVPAGEFLFYDPACPPRPDTCFRQPFLEGRPAGADPCCPNLEINRFPAPVGFDASFNNQLIRLDEPGGSGLDERFQAAMAAAGSPLANLFLVNTQWPFNGRRPAPPGSPPGTALAENTRDCAVATGLPAGTCYTRVPEFLRNTVIESYMTTWIDDDQGHPRQISNRSCMSCHADGTDFSYVFEDAVELTVDLE